jgi:hypothetical protein
MLRVDFTSQDYLRNPATGLKKLRAAGPVVEVRFRSSGGPGSPQPAIWPAVF